MDKELALFIRSFKGELSKQDEMDLSSLLEDGNIARKYGNYRKIWDRALSEGGIVIPDSDKTWNRLSAEMESGRNKRRRRIVAVSLASLSGIAAILAVFFSLNMLPGNDFSEDMLSEAATTEWKVSPSDKIIFRTAAGKYYTIDSKQAEISAMDDGSVSINSVLIDSKPVKGYNRIKVPRGKMARLNLPDGSRICLNALAELTFPSEFPKTERPVYLSGEAYFSVSKDERKPFTVMSDRMNVSVLGTEFNFEASGQSSVVTLVSGKVSVKTDMADSCVLFPNQQVSAENGKLGAVSPVDVETVICWTSHKIICKDQNIAEVFDRLSLYFDKDFICREPLDDIIISGKLDLTMNLDSVLETIAFIAPVRFSKQGERIAVTRVE